MTALQHGDTLPETFLDLDEVVVPFPVSHHEDNQDSALERALTEEQTGSWAHYSGDRASNLVPVPRSRVHNRPDIRESTDNGETLYQSGTSSRLSSNISHVPSNNEKVKEDIHNRAQGNVFPNQSQVYHSHLTEVSTPAPVDVPHQTQEQNSDNQPFDQSSEPSEFVTKIYTISYLIFFAIWGTLARLGLQALTVYPGAPVTQGVLWPNVGGSLIMGFLTEDRRLFGEPLDDTSTHLSRISTSERNKKHAAVKKTIPLYIGLSTGFCGCFTSFSSWQRDSFLALSNAAIPNAIPRNGGFSFLALLATLILTPTLCLAALQVGAHIALGLESVTPVLNFRVIRQIVNPLIVPIALLSWFAAVLLAIWPPDRPSGSAGHKTWAEETWRGDAVLACVFAPLGCLTRVYVSLWLNSRLPAFPLGTFTVNVFGSILEAIFYDLQHARLPMGIGGGLLGCQILQGLMDGYCGCTTTISTWVAELKGLRRRHAYIYGGASIFIGLAFMIIIMGSLQWSRGLEATACGK